MARGDLHNPKHLGQKPKDWLFVTFDPAINTEVQKRITGSLGKPRINLIPLTKHLESHS